MVDFQNFCSFLFDSFSLCTLQYSCWPLHLLSFSCAPDAFHPLFYLFNIYMHIFNAIKAGEDSYWLHPFYQSVHLSTMLSLLACGQPMHPTHALSITLMLVERPPPPATGDSLGSEPQHARVSCTSQSTTILRRRHVDFTTLLWSLYGVHWTVM